MLPPLPLVAAVAAENRPIQPRLERQADWTPARRAFSTVDATVAIFGPNSGWLRQPHRAIAQICQHNGVALRPPQRTAVGTARRQGHAGSAARCLFAGFTLEELSTVNANRRALAGRLIDMEWMAHGSCRIQV